MKPTIKVWPVPRLTEQQLRELFFNIVRVCQLVPQLHVYDEDDVIVGFPKDAMMFGLGTELVVEVGVPSNLTNITEERCQGIATEIGHAVRAFFYHHGFTPSVQYEYRLTHGGMLE